MNELRSILEQRMRDLGVGEECTPPGLIYHYTTAAGLKGILENRHIFATHAAYLNDLSELRYGHGVAADYLLERLEEGRASITKGLRQLGELTVELHDTVVAGVGSQFHLANYARKALDYYDPKDSYVTSCCEDGDLLSQWRGYANKGGGYAVGFSVTKSVNGIENGEFGVFKVWYDRNRQTSLLDEILQEVMKKLSELNLPDNPNDEWLFVMKRHGITLSWFVKLICMRFKDDAFSEENEWRFLAQKDAGDPDLVEFREVNGLLVPYLVFPIMGDGIEIKKIVCGPALHPELSRRSVEMLARKNGISELEVVNSRIPLGTI